MSDKRSSINSDDYEVVDTGTANYGKAIQDQSCMTLMQSSSDNYKKRRRENAAVVAAAAAKETAKASASEAEKKDEKGK